MHVLDALQYNNEVLEPKFDQSANTFEKHHTSDERESILKVRRGFWNMTMAA